MLITTSVHAKYLIFTPQPLRAVGVLFSPMVSGWVGGRSGRQTRSRLGGWAGKFVKTVSQKQYGVGSSYVVWILVRGCRCATSWSGLDLTFDLAAVTLSLKCCLDLEFEILSRTSF